ncbi:aminotransferase class V-fold PLP-dependent enzyme [Aquibacillus halophilus]|uniref:Aminotransferase class V-fold PLP-dependent enzyme n=1 Tax=Aquibacillus halophilus TaxID=930132 RepID=A0A6A8DH08_9BACI|nr:IscS subfamily cysteine desulfurase [Aquibacillus halophilus]MRH42991.1 aminotransferase class V-fold PLP-dependent enzyme [Aquibacillus halophilus]
MIYLDYAATTPISDNALNVYNEVSKNFFGNSSSLHDIGTSAKNLLAHCRSELADLIHANEKGLLFTGGGTESNVLAIETLINSYKGIGNHIITTEMEHSSLLNYFKYLEENKGYHITYLSPNKQGEINVDDLIKAISSTTILASIQHANSEIGVVQPIEKIGKLLNQHGILFHSDCVQTFGKLPINVQQAQLDSLSISSHKIYGPKGVGAIYVNPSLKGNSAKSSGQPGTANVPGIAAFVTAAQDAYKDIDKESFRLLKLRQQFLTSVKKRKLRMEIITNDHLNLPHIIGILLDNVQGDYAMLEFNRAGIAVSTGSACSVGHQQPTKAVLAIGKSEAEAKQFIRLSLGKYTSNVDIEEVVTLCEKIINNY